MKNKKVSPKTIKPKKIGVPADVAISDELTSLRYENKMLLDANLKLQKQLSDLKNTLRLLADTCPDLLWAKDIENRYIFVNKAMCDKLLIAKNVHEPLGKNDQFFANRQRLLHTENPNYHTFGEICSDTDDIVKLTQRTGKFDEYGNVQGKFLYLDVHKAPIFDKNFQVIGTVGSGRIVTKEKETEQALRESEQIFKSLAHNISDVILRFHIDGTITFANNAAIQFSKKKNNSIIGKSIEEAGFPESIIRFCIQRIKEIITGKHSVKGQCQVPTQRGIKTFDCVFTAEYNDQGDLFSILVIAHEITELIKSRQFLELEEIRLNALLKLSQMDSAKEKKVYEFSLQQALKLSNSKYGFLACLDSSKDKLILYAISKEIDISGKRHSGQFSEIIIQKGSYCYKVIKSHKPLIINDFNESLLSKSCCPEWIQHLSRVILIPIAFHNDILSVLMVADKPTNYNKEDLRQLNLLMDGFRYYLQQQKFYKELIEAKEKAIESDRLKSAFLANMSHEIRTPMNGIIGFAELLGKTNLEDDRRVKYLTIINSSAHQLLRIISDIVDISKIEAGQMYINREKCDLPQLMSHMVQRFEMELKLKQKEQIKLRNFSNNSPEYICTDQIRLEQIISNLLGNAIKFTEKGYIDFGYQFIPESNSVMFFVKDTGIGIPEGQLKLIFERFRQVNNHASRKYGGTGLGLSISKGLVDLLGGKMWVDSEEGKGSTFYFTLSVNN
jgi:PAS domain S-box-containing protein